jgi:hypothetical protein
MFQVILQKSPTKGGWTYLVLDGGTISIKAGIRKKIGTSEGDTITVRLTERLQT